MARNMTLNQLTEGIRERHLGTERNRLIEKWNRTGLLRGMDDYNRETMSQLLENQAAQLLREANTLGSGGSANNVDGFSNIAFPIVRRVFGGLVANDLVSIQPMSLPSGLLFYLDYSYGSDVGGNDSGSSVGNEDLTSDAAMYAKGDSLYGQPGGNSIRTGADAVGGMYDLAGSGYSKAYLTGSGTTVSGATAGSFHAAGTGANSVGAYNSSGTWTSGANFESTYFKNVNLVQADPQLLAEYDNYGTSFQIIFVDISNLSNFDKTMVKSVALIDDTGADGAVVGIDDWDAGDSAGKAWQGGKRIFNLRRLNQLGSWDGSNWTPRTPEDASATDLLLVVKGTTTSSDLDTDLPSLDLVYPKTDTVAAEGGTGGTLVIPSFESNFAATPLPIIPEIDIKIESIAVTAQTRKLRARWSPELAQDLNAYHSLDAEVELTQILSEQIALEIDREILNDLLVGAQGANFFWSRAPGKFVNKRTGQAQNLASTLATGPQFTGTVREWYETLVETIIDVANEIHRKTLRGSANFIVCSPEVATIFEASVLYKPTIKIDGQGQTGPEFSIGAQAIGSLSNRFTVYKDPYFPRNKILVGYKGGSYLETGYVYAPYVPLIVTPTLFAPEDFTPRKGVMTRYGKKMVRADFYGTVTCLDMDII